MKKILISVICLIAVICIIVINTFPKPRTKLYVVYLFRKGYGGCTVNIKDYKNDDTFVDMVTEKLQEGNPKDKGIVIINWKVLRD